MNPDHHLEESLISTIGGLSAELDQLQRNLDTELKFISALEQKLTQARSRAATARGQGDLLEEAVRKADVEMTRLERATELAVRSTEIGKRHAGQVTERLRLQRELCEEQRKQLGKRVVRLEALAAERLKAIDNNPVPAAANKPNVTDFIKLAVEKRILKQ